MTLVRAPFRISFAFAGPDRLWRDTWRDAAQLPTAIRLQVRDAGSDQVLAVSTAVLLNVDLPAECVGQRSVEQCLAGVIADAETLSSRHRTCQIADDHGSLLSESRRRPAQNQRGFILVAVLWILAALATLASVYAVYVDNAAFATQVDDDRLRIHAALLSGSNWPPTSWSRAAGRSSAAWLVRIAFGSIDDPCDFCD